MVFMKMNCLFLSKGVDKLMEDLLKCVSRAEPSRAEPSRAEPSRAEPSRAELCYNFALLYEYVGCFALLEGGRCFGRAKRALHWGFLPSGSLFLRFLYIFLGEGDEAGFW